MPFWKSNFANLNERSELFQFEKCLNIWLDRFLGNAQCTPYFLTRTRSVRRHYFSYVNFSSGQYTIYIRSVSILHGQNQSPIKFISVLWCQKRIESCFWNDYPLNYAVCNTNLSFSIVSTKTLTYFKIDLAKILTSITTHSGVTLCAIYKKGQCGNFFFLHYSICFTILYNIYKND